MRLTLRTLLAYLDNTLSPADADALRAKLADSGFATTLVSRIRQTLTRTDLSAASPAALDPRGDANAVGEYLDNAMPPQQIAELERATLESDMQLAEMAACHQILTMVLGKPASVPDSLRYRIYRLPNELPAAGLVVADGDADSSANPATAAAANVAASNGSVGEPFTTGADPSPTSLHPTDQSADPATPQPTLNSPASVAPVGRADSGVTRGIPPMTAGTPTASGPPPVLTDEYRMDGRGIPWTRVMPYLVSLGLLLVLVFALVQVFRPLLSGDDRVVAEANLPPMPRADSDRIPASVDQPSSSDEAVVAPPAPNGIDLGDVEMLPAENSVTTIDPASIPAEPSDLEMPDQNLPPPSNVDDAADFTPPTETMPAESLPAEPAAAEPAATEPAPAEPAATEPMPTEPMAAEPTPGPEPTIASETDVSNDDATVPPPAETASLATFVAEPNSLLIRRLRGDTAVADVDASGLPVTIRWGRVADGGGVAAGTPIVVPPQMRATLTFPDGPQLTAFGPAELLLDKVGSTPFVELRYGQTTISAGGNATDMMLMLGPTTVACRLDDDDASLAASVQYRRQPGEPLMSPVRSIETQLLSIAGTMNWALTGNAGDETGTLQSGEGWTQTIEVSADPDAGDTDGRRVMAAGEVIVNETPLPDWTAGPALTGIEALASDGLLSFLTVDKPIEIALREATTFRRDEVAGLAGDTLATIGRADVYFGVDGLLNKESQKSYWSNHYQMLLKMAARGPSVSAAILEDMKRMDSAGEPAIRRMLRGYSQTDLEAGGDAELVAALDSPSLPIRVLAIQNLEAITGKNLLYRAEYATAAKREASIKKWQGWLRRGDIRWQAAQQ